MKAKDWLTILKLAAQKKPPITEDKVACDSLKRSGLAVTERHVFLYNLGMLPAVLFLIGLIVFCLESGPYGIMQTLTQTPFGFRLLGLFAPALVIGALFLAVRRSVPALALGLRHGALFCFVLYFPFLLIINLKASAQAHESMTYDSGTPDWWGLAGWGVGALMIALLPVWLMWSIKWRPKQLVIGSAEKRPSQSVTAIIISTCFAAMTIFVLTAHHGQVFRYLLSYVH